MLLWKLYNKGLILVSKTFYEFIMSQSYLVRMHFVAGFTADFMHELYYIPSTNRRLVFGYAF